MEPQWELYYRYVGDTPTPIFVDLALREYAPDPSRPHLIWVSVPFRYPQPDGSATLQEGAKLDAIENALAAAFGDALDALVVGSATFGKCRNLYFYAPHAEELPEIVRAAMAPHPGYRVDCGQQPDPGWSEYLEFLFPAPREFQHLQNRRAVQALERAGDPLTTPRPVTHWVYFPAEEQRAEASQRLRALGFTTIPIDGPEDAPELLGLRVERADAVDCVSIEQVVDGFLDALEGLDYYYDGWETEVVRPRPGLLGKLLNRG